MEVSFCLNLFRCYPLPRCNAISSNQRIYSGHDFIGSPVYFNQPFPQKNKPGKYVIVYDENEQIAPKVATTMTQKGFDNVYMLSGGLREMYEKRPEHVYGLLPPKPKTARKLNF